MLYLLSLLVAYGLSSFVAEISFLGVFCICIILPIIIQLVCYYNQVTGIEYIEECNDNIKIYKEQADEVLSEIKLHLIDKYPEHELKIFEKITNKTYDILAVKYPELKTDEVFKKYIDSLIKYKDNIYHAKKAINRHKRELRIRERTIALTALPILPKE